MSRAAHYPLLAQHTPEATFAWRAGQAVSTRQFIHDARQVAEQLPEAGYALNLCEDRYLFLVGFVALMLRDQVDLLPPNGARRVIEAIAREHHGSYCLLDQPRPEISTAQHIIRLNGQTASAFMNRPELPANQVVAMVFTSGSTGHAKPNIKHWGELYLGAQGTKKALGLNEQGTMVVATVPPQHMFGLETSVILPLVTPLSVYGGRPFFPEDLRGVLAGLDAPVVLVTTPLHLRACIDADLDWPPVAAVVSATAPLRRETAARAEELFGCELWEIYGCTETGAIATRRTVGGIHWRPHPGIILNTLGDEVQAGGGHLARPVILGDNLNLVSDGRFTLEGRHGDMVKIAGKRASLADLNLQLQSIPGVEDGVFVMPGNDARQEGRLTALVVAPKLDSNRLLSELRERIDSVFLPRPVYRVDTLPRNETGKLTRAAVMDLLVSLGKH